MTSIAYFELSVSNTMPPCCSVITARTGDVANTSGASVVFGHGAAHRIRHSGCRRRQLITFDDVPVVEHLGTTVASRDLADPDVLGQPDITSISVERSDTDRSKVIPAARCTRRTGFRDRGSCRSCRWSRPASRRRVAMRRFSGWMRLMTWVTPRVANAWRSASRGGFGRVPGAPVLRRDHPAGLDLRPPLGEPDARPGRAARRST